MSNIQIAAKAELFGTPIDAAFISKEHKNIKGKDELNYTVSEKIIVVYGKPEEPIRQSLTDVLDKLTFGLIKVEQLKAKLPEAIGKTLDGIMVSINQIYFKDGNVNFNETVSTTIPTGSTLIDFNKKYPVPEKEYALWIDIEVDPELIKGFPVSIKTLSLKVWSTNNTQILQEMKITDIQKLLAGAGIATEAVETV